MNHRKIFKIVTGRGFLATASMVALYRTIDRVPLISKQIPPNDAVRAAILLPRYVFCDLLANTSGA